MLVVGVITAVNVRETAAVGKSSEMNAFCVSVNINIFEASGCKVVVCGCGKIIKLWFLAVEDGMDTMLKGGWKTKPGRLGVMV